MELHQTETLLFTADALGINRLKDRKGRKLSFYDLFHWQKIVVALKETMRLMGEIDELSPSWPIE